MDNNKMNFDPMTGLPISQTNNMNELQPNIPVQNNIDNSNLQYQNIPLPTQEVNTQTYQNTLIDTETVNNPNDNIQQQIQNIPTVEQSKTEFINNVNVSVNETKKEDKKDGPNITFIIILFAIIFASVFFLFPYLLEVL